MIAFRTGLTAAFGEEQAERLARDWEEAAANYPGIVDVLGNLAMMPSVMAGGSSDALVLAHQTGVADLAKDLLALAKPPAESEYRYRQKIQERIHDRSIADPRPNQQPGWPNDDLD